MTDRNFKGIWIPAEVWLTKKLTLVEKLFLVEIDSLDNEKGCFASNKYFAEFFDLSKGRCSQIISSLEKKNLIKIKLIREGKQVKERRIYLVNKLNRGYLENDNTPSKNIKGGYLENDKENNTKAIIQKENNNIRKFSKPTNQQIAEYLKEKQQQMDIDYFIDYYESKDWMIGKNRMKNWKSAVNNWLRNNKKFEVQSNANNNTRKLTPFEERENSIRKLLDQAEQEDNESFMGSDAGQVPINMET